MRSNNTKQTYHFLPIIEDPSAHSLCTWVIAGPCSAESYEQMRETALSLSAMGVTWFRAGVWKPRTRPGGFEGMGEEALSWIRELKKEFPYMTFCTEVATATHVRLCLEYGLDALWIGARTTSNPFMMQEIADALQGVDIPVLVKNPVSPDIELWIGAIDRLYNAGLRRIAAIHRGFSSLGRGLYRNPPHWSLVMELRSRIPNLLLLGDPSHMAGRRDLIPSLCRQLIHLHYDGIMLEVHPSPDLALSDAAQQLTPNGFSEILQHICIQESPSNAEIILAPLREKIDGLDHSIIELISERMTISAEIAKLKALNDISVVQPERYNSLLQERLQFSKSQELSEALIKAIFDLIHDESIALQNKIVLGLKQ